MPTYNIRGINVDFPFEAYDCQLVYMDKVIQSLQSKGNALLESPTGTGKTLCLLCATLAWRRSFGEFTRGRSERSSIRGSQSVDEDPSESESSQLPTIIYTSRTHSQIKQVIKELKRSNYRPKMVVLGSREQLCIHDQVSLLRGKAQTNACHALCKKRTKRFCANFSRVAGKRAIRAIVMSSDRNVQNYVVVHAMKKDRYCGEFVQKNPSIGEDPIDIEDLVNLGKSSGSCPYYLSREIHKNVDILFAPYNYLIDRGNRKSLKIDWTKCILIFDEAHNLESLCADAASFDLPASLLTACIAEAKNCIDLSVARRDTSNDKSFDPDNFAILRALLLKLEKRISEVPIQTKELGFTKDGPYIYELLSELNITQQTANMLMGTIEKACELLEEEANGGAVRGGSHKANGTVCRLESMGDILGLIFKDNNSTAHAQYYRLHIQEVESKSADDYRGTTSRTLSWWCFNPGIAMEEFSRLGVKSIILTSGTLSPMDSFAEELKLEFPIRLENPHVISGNQIWAGVVPVGPSGYSFNSSYRSRGSIEYKTELGNAIVNFARIVPDGLLVFFPSYYLLEQCISYWKDQQSLSNSTTIWERICKHKLPVVEPRQSSLFPVAIEDYMTKLKGTSSGAVFFAVCRGKVSEGLDFADHAGRAVVITGLPFATLTDPKVRLKREYLDHQRHARKSISKGLTGEEWYSQQTLRAINQAIGRVIRHQHDYGAIILCDERFTQPHRQSQISSWIRPHLKCYSKFGDIIYTLTRFFRDGKACCTPKLDFTQKKGQECAGVSQSSQSLDTIHLENLLKTAVNPTTTSLDSVSTTEQVKHGSISSYLKEILPANRSSLSSEKLLQDSTMKCSRDLTESMIIDAKSMQDYDEKAVNLGSPILVKKRKLLITGPDQSKHGEKSHHFSNLVKKEHLHFSENVHDHNPQENKILVHDIKREERTIELCNARQKDVSETVSQNSNETKGSAFLVQIREKLTDSEYTEFLGLMKALKSKAMKIGQVLQSIASLFSLPDRLSLLHGFKEYVPVKYRSLYEHYIGTNSDAAGL